MTKAVHLLALATTALRDLHQGYPAKEVCANQGTGLVTLLYELVEYLRGQGIDDEGAWNCAATAGIPVAAKREIVQSLLRELKADGLTIGECIEVLAAPAEDPYVRKARDLVSGDDCLIVGERTVIAPAETGAHVLSWLWVDNEEAGVCSNAELLEGVLVSARVALAGDHDLEGTVELLRIAQAEWLEELITNYPDELNSIGSVVPNKTPAPVVWVGRDGWSVSFMPSDALRQLLRLACRGALTVERARNAERFCEKFGDQLDSLLTVVQTA